MDKKKIADTLTEMAVLLELRGANPFKSRAFQNASRTIEGLPVDVTALVESGEIQNVKGIGKGISAVITDLVTTGQSTELNELKEGIPDGVFDMLRIQGLGPKKVRILFEKLKITSLDALESAAKDNKLADLDGFGKKSEENILRGIQSVRSHQGRTLYPKAQIAADQILEKLSKETGVIRVELAGSLRRRKETIGDIDILVSAKASDRERLMKVFTTDPGVQSILGSGESKSSVILESGINCDLRVVSDAEFPFALNYFTGSKEHNVEMRSRARKLGLSLNEYAFSPIESTEPKKKKASIPKCKDESDIYKSLGLSYIPPELRENLGEFEAAESNELPDLVCFEDIRGTFHCHTTYSDGLNSIEEMATAAKALGWEYLGIADHSKAAAYAGGLSSERVKQQVAEIDALNTQMKGFRIFKGTECDILPDGNLDWNESVLKLFDYVVISVHSNFNMNEKEMTKRIVKALKNKHVTMLGHPTGRLLLSRDPYPVNMIDVINAASDYGKMIEINAHPMRLDLDWRLCKYAKEKGIIIPINPDAHKIDGLRDVKYGVGIARKGWLEKKDVLNTRTVEAVSKYLNYSK